MNRTMESTGGKVNPAYILVMILNGTVISIYYTATRIAIGRLLGENYGFIALMVAMESAPGLLSFLMGYLSDRFREGLTLYSGFIASILLAYMGLTPVKAYPLLAFLYTVFYMSYQPAVMGAVLHESRGRGARLSYYLLSSSLGWAVGGFVPGIIMKRYPLYYSFFLAAGILFSASLIAIKRYPNIEYERPTLTEFKGALRYNKHVMAVFVLGSSGITLFIGAYSLKLYNVIEDPIGFGIVFTTITGILGASVRPLAGKLVDHYSPEAVLASSFAAYICLGLIAPFLSRLPLIIVWLTPLYPFYELSSYALISRRMPRHLQSTAAGVFTTSASLGGIINALASITLFNSGFTKAMGTSIAILSLPVLYILYLKLSRIL